MSKRWLGLIVLLSGGTLLAGTAVDFGAARSAELKRVKVAMR